MYPDSALSAGQLAIMAVVVVALAGGMAHRGVPRRPAATRHIRGREAGPHEEDAAATVTQLPSATGHRIRQRPYPHLHDHQEV